MSQETKSETVEQNETALSSWQAGVVGGLLGSFAFGLIMVLVIPDPVLEVAIPNLYGVEATPDTAAPGIGWTIHLAHGAILGVVFAVLLELGIPSKYADSPVAAGSIGLAYGVIVWAGFAVLVMPVWLSAVGFPGAPPLPNIAELSLLGHAVYGLLLGLSYDLLT